MYVYILMYSDVHICMYEYTCTCVRYELDAYTYMHQVVQCYMHIYVDKR